MKYIDYLPSRKIQGFREGDTIPRGAKFIRSITVNVGTLKKEQWVTVNLFEVEYEDKSGLNPAYTKRKTESKAKT